MQRMSVQTVIGPIQIEGDSTAITRIRVGDRCSASPQADDPTPAGDLVQQMAEQLQAYFAGQRQTFTVDRRLPRASEFTQAVWRELEAIPLGQTLSYAQLARRIGKPNAARAVGGANHHNPLPIIIPCHRVIQADGTLGGYGGGAWIKQRLLDHERRVLRQRAHHHVSSIDEPRRAAMNERTANTR